MSVEPRSPPEPNAAGEPSLAALPAAKPAPAQEMTPATTTILFLGLAAWASAFPGINYGLEFFTPGELSFLRFLIASACFGILIAFGAVRLPPRRDWPAIALLGVIGVAVYQLCLSYAMTRVASGAAAVLIALAPAVTTALAAWRLGESITRRMLAGLGVAFAGAVVVTLGSGAEIRFEPLALLILISVVATSIYFVWQKPIVQRTSSLGFTAVSFFATTIALAPFALDLPAKLPAAPAGQLWAMLWLGVIPSFAGYVLWTLGVSRAPVGRASMLVYAQPLMAGTIAWFWLGQVPTMLAVIGGAVLLLGVVLGSGGPRRRA